MALVSQDLFKMSHGYEEGEKFCLAKYYLYCASIEIGLKAAILAVDCTEAKKKHIFSLRHDLCKVRASFETVYSSIWNNADIEAVEKINPFFKKKGLEYFTPDVRAAAVHGYSEFPEIGHMAAAAQKVNALLVTHKLFIEAKTSDMPRGA